MFHPWSDVFWLGIVGTNVILIAFVMCNQTHKIFGWVSFDIEFDVLSFQSFKNPAIKGMSDLRI